MEPVDDKQEEHFKKLVHEAKPDSPSDAFTRAVMLRVAEEVAFKAVMQQNAVEIPSPAFTAGIIAQIRAAEAPAPAKPIAFKQVGYWIAASWAVLVIACFFIPGNEQPSVLLTALNGIALSNNLFTQRVFTIPQPYMLTVIGLSCLVLLDYFLRNRSMLINKTARS